MSTETPTTAATSAPSTEDTPSIGKIARKNLSKFRANFNPAHTAANLLRKTGTLVDKLPSPGEVARTAATRLDAMDPKAYRKRIEELQALEQAVVSKFASGSGN